MTPVPALPRPLRVPKMAELVSQQLRRQIIGGELAEGDALPSEASLMTQFGISRPTLREAFRVLESEGLISIRRGPHGGARVQTPSDDAAARYAGSVLEFRGTTLRDVYDAQAIIEPPCAELLAHRRKDADLVALRGQLDETRAALHDAGAAIELLNDFHALVIRLSGNQTMQVLNGMVRHIIDRSTTRHVTALAGSRRGAKALVAGFAEHEKVVELIALGEPARARRLWQRHLDEARRHHLTRSPASSILDLLERE